MLINFLKKIGNDQRGGTAVEYALIASLVVIACVGAFKAVADENTNMWSIVSSKVTSSMSGSTS